MKRRITFLLNVMLSFLLGITVFTTPVNAVSRPNEYSDLESAVKATGGNQITQYQFVSGSAGFGGGGAEQLWDGDIQTKFYTNEFPAHSIVRLQAPRSICGVILVTANDTADYPGRNPSQWTVYGSSDGKSWYPIISADDSFLEEKNYTYYVGTVTAAQKYSYFKFEASGNDTGVFQLSEVILCEKKESPSGQVIGKVLATDIRAYINGAEIPAYNIDGKLAVVVSDLNNYGFKTQYNNDLRMTTVTRDKTKTAFTSVPSKASGLPIGTPVMNVLSSDIVVELDGKQVEAFNVDNRMAIYFTDLKVYGESVYDNAARASKLTLK